MPVDARCCTAVCGLTVPGRQALLSGWNQPDFDWLVEVLAGYSSGNFVRIINTMLSVNFFGFVSLQLAAL
jgi:hypothetical protein